MSRKVCLSLACAVSLCCSTLSEALSIQGYQSLAHDAKVLHGRLWLAPEQVDYAHLDMHVSLEEKGHRVPLHASVAYLNQRPFIEVSSDTPRSDPNQALHFLIRYTEKGESRIVSYTPLGAKSEVSAPVISTSTPTQVHPQVTQHTEQTKAGMAQHPVTPLADTSTAPLATKTVTPTDQSQDRGRTIYLKHDALIYAIAEKFPVEKISKTRMSAYLHIFNPKMVFTSQSGMLAAQQYLYIPTIEEVMGLDTTLWKSYRRALLENIQEDQKAQRHKEVKSTPEAIHKVSKPDVKPQVMPVVPAQNHVRVERAVLSTNNSATHQKAAVEDRLSESVAKEKMQKDISVLDSKISQLMTEVSRREQALHKKEHEKALQSTAETAHAASPIPDESSTEKHSVVVPDHATGAAGDGHLRWWMQALLVCVCLFLYWIYRIFSLREVRVEEAHKKHFLSEELRSEIKTRVQEDLTVSSVSPQESTVTQTATQMQTTSSPSSAKTTAAHRRASDLSVTVTDPVAGATATPVAEETSVLEAVKKEDLLLQKTASVSELLKSAEKSLSQGEDAVAERLLIDGITKMPTETPLYLKLLHIYFKNGLEEPAHNVINTVYALTKGQGSDWKSLLHMSKRYKVRYPQELEQRNHVTTEVSS